MLLLAVLTSLVFYFVTSQTGVLGLGAVGQEDCSAAGEPSLASLSRTQLLELRDGLRGVVTGGSGRLYEQGLVESSYMWSDGEPGTSKSLPPGPRHPGGYELRWRLADGDVVAADAMVFADAGQAHDFFERASSSRCRTAGAAFDASSPPGGRNIVWRNPDGFAQEDLFLLRGRRVYRVAVVLAAVGSLISPAARHVGFSLVNDLACALSGAACHSHGTPVLIPATGVKA